MVEEGVIAPHDLDLIHWSEDANEAWEFVQNYYEEHLHPVPEQTAPPE
jgi:predicted Rossmann-fold nucleotide-binding protein